MKKTVFISIMFLLFAVSAHAAIDQNQPDENTYMSGFFQADLAQSFQQSANNIYGAGILLEETGSANNITISLYNTLPDEGGTLLASGTALGTPGGWVDVFWSSIGITPGATYYLVFTSSDTSLGIAGSLNNPYPYGMVYANEGFNAFPDYDYAFRTYSGRNENVPEPASALLIGLGLVGIAGIRKKMK